MNTTPTTKQERSNQIDHVAARLYRRRFEIERLQERRRLERELKETWQ